MELEELKREWDLLSGRLDRQHLICRENLVRILRLHIGSYLHYVQFMLLLGIAAVPGVVAIGKFRGVSDATIGWILCGYILLFLPSFYAFRLLRRISRCDIDIVEQERRMIRYTTFVRSYYLFQGVVVVLCVIGLLLWAADYYSAHQMWWIVTGTLAVALVVGGGAVRYEWSRICELRQRIADLRKFDAE